MISSVTIRMKVLQYYRVHRYLFVYELVCRDTTGTDQYPAGYEQMTTGDDVSGPEAESA